MLAPIALLGSIILFAILLGSFMVAQGDKKTFPIFWAISIPLVVIFMTWFIVSGVSETTYPADTYSMIATDSSQIAVDQSGNCYNLTRIFEKIFSPEKQSVRIAKVKSWSLGMWWPGEKVVIEIVDKQGNIVASSTYKVPPND